MNLAEKMQLAEEANALFEQSPPELLLKWAVARFPAITLACSFGAEDVVLVHMLQRLTPGIDMFYLDTHFHFPETYETRDRLAERYGIKFIKVEPELTPRQQAERFGEQLWKTDPDQCCQIRKVNPLSRILSRYDAWITGIRREQSLSRVNTVKAMYDTKFGLMKLNPLADWKQDEVWRYIRQYDIPYNPLHDRHYPSIGCMQCTRPVQPGEDMRAGRWSGLEKTECGLHS